MAKIIDLTGKKFGRLTVVNRAEDYVTPNGQKCPQWECRCDCGNSDMVIVRGSYLRDGRTVSCGCYKKEVNSKRYKKYNTYNLSGEYGIGYTSNTKEAFYFDLEDYDLIKSYCWYKGSYGYIMSNKDGEHVKLHRLVMNASGNEHVDHIKHNKNDNRKSMLRIVTVSQNQMNKGLQKNNTSGVTGVYYNKIDCCWFARIKVNKNTIHLGSFTSFDDAVKARKDAEKKYFGKYSYDSSMNVNDTDKVICNKESVDLSWLNDLA